MKKLLIKIAGALFVILAVCINVYVIYNKVNAPEPQQKVSLATYERKSKIKVSYDIQDVILEGKRKLVTYVKNDSDKIYSGSVYITVKNSIGETLCWDIVYPENVESGKQTYAITGVPICDGYNVSSNITEYNFQ